MTSPHPVPTGHPAEHPTNHRPDQRVRLALWVVLVLSAVANAATSVTGVHMAIGLAFGVITLACAVALVVQHGRSRA